ncbi:putative TAF5-like RNA polymerase, partial [Naja naja]
MERRFSAATVIEATKAAGACNAGRPSQLSLQKVPPGGKTGRATTGVRDLRNTSSNGGGVVSRGWAQNHPRSPRLARPRSFSLSSYFHACNAP